jgi:Putative conjugal transfer nickase/helicase TraI C-term/Putative helicase
MAHLNDFPSIQHDPLDVLHLSKAERLLPLIQVRMGFPRETFVLAVSPIIDGLAQHWGLASSSVPRLNVLGGRLLGSMELALRVLDLSRARVLPPHAPPEELGALAPRWIYALVLASLLKDIRDENPDLAWLFLETYLPEAVQIWLQEDPSVWSALTGSLSAKPGNGNLIEDIVDIATGRRGPVQVRSVAADPEFTAQIPTSYGQRSSWQAPQTLPEVDSAPTQLVADFFAWLHAGLRDQTMKVNSPDALVHHVSHGLLLVSPGLFRSFLQVAKLEVEPFSDPLKVLQRDLFKLGWHVKGDGGVNIQSYVWTQGPKAGSKVHGVVMKSAQRLVHLNPPINTDLVSVVN